MGSVCCVRMFRHSGLGAKCHIPPFVQRVQRVVDRINRSSVLVASTIDVRNPARRVRRSWRTFTGWPLFNDRPCLVLNAGSTVMKPDSVLRAVARSIGLKSPVRLARSTPIVTRRGRRLALAQNASVNVQLALRGRFRPLPAYFVGSSTRTA